jgi:hypothetical protein
VDLSSCPLIDTQPIASKTNTTEMPRGTKNEVPLRSTDVLSLSGLRVIFTYLGRSRVRSQVLDQSSLDARLVCGFHMDMHSA